MCGGAPLAFIFQIRQADYPLLLQHATWVRPSSDSSEGTEPPDAGRLLFQFFYCLGCRDGISSSHRSDRYGLQHSAALTDTSQHVDPSDVVGTGDRLSEPQCNQLRPVDLTHPNWASGACLGMAARTECHACPTDVQSCVGVITQCTVHRHIFHFSWDCGVMFD